MSNLAQRKKCVERLLCACAALGKRGQYSLIHLCSMNRCPQYLYPLWLYKPPRLDN